MFGITGTLAPRPYATARRRPVTWRETWSASAIAFVYATALVATFIVALGLPLLLTYLIGLWAGVTAIGLALYVALFLWLWSAERRYRMNRMIVGTPRIG